MQKSAKTKEVPALPFKHSRRLFSSHLIVSIHCAVAHGVALALQWLALCRCTIAINLILCLNVVIVLLSSIFLFIITCSLVVTYLLLTFASCLCLSPTNACPVRQLILNSSFYLLCSNQD